MQLSVIIVNYNTFELTSRCIQSLYERLTGVEFEIILVDNASVECDPLLFLKAFPAIKLITTSVNTGFAGGNNLGIQDAVGNYLLLLNSDTELINNAPAICIEHLMNHANVGLVTCQLQYPDGRLQYNCRRFRTISWELLELIPLYKFLSRQRKESLMLHHYFNHDRMMQCDWVWGTFMMMKKSIVDLLPDGKLSEEFFMYCEDVLWCWQIKQLGFIIQFLPEAKVMHIHKGSVDKEKLQKVRLTGIKNHGIFMKKFYPDYRWYIFAMIFYSKQYVALLLNKYLK